MRAKTLLLALPLLSLYFAGCAGSSSGPDVVSTPAHPKAGSVFLTRNTTRDSTGVVADQDTTTATVVRSGLTIDGFTDVIEVVESDPRGLKDTTYLQLQANGDIRVRSVPANVGGTPVLGQWINEPFGTQQKVDVTIDTTVIDTLGVSTHIHEAVSFAPAGHGTFTIKGVTYSTNKLTMTVTLPNPFDPSINMTIQETAAYAPGIGYVATTDSPASRSPFDGSLSGSSHSELFDFELH